MIDLFLFAWELSRAWFHIVAFQDFPGFVSYVHEDSALLTPAYIVAGL